MSTANPTDPLIGSEYRSDQRNRAHHQAADLAGLVWRVVRYQPVLFALGGGAWVLWWTLPALLGLLLKAIFDRIAGGPAGVDLVSLVALLVAVEGTRLAIFRVVIVWWTRWWAYTETLLRTNMLRAQLASGGPGVGAPVASSGAAVTVFRNDVEDLIIFVDSWIDLAGTALFGIVALAIMLQIDARVTLIVVLPLVIAYAVTKVVTGRLRAYRRDDREATARVTGFLGNLFSAVLAVKVAGAQDSAVARLRSLNATRQRTALRDRVLADSLEAFNGSTVEVTIGLVLLLVAPAMRSGDFSVGDLVLFASYVTALAALPRWAGRILTRHRHAQVSAARMGALMPRGSAPAVARHRHLDLGDDRPATPMARPPRPQPAAVGVRGLRVCVADGRALASIDLDLAPGSFTVVCGPVGSGKTTLLRALLGLAGPIEGTVTWNGDVVCDLAAHMVPPRCAYLPQVPRLFSASLRENLTLGVATPAVLLDDAVRRAAFDRDVAEMPDGLDTLVGPRGVRLSGGQLQRAATARALASEPALLVLDDLSSALDAGSERLVWERLFAGVRPTCLAVSHRAAALERADQIVVLDAGRVRATGTLTELRAAGLDPLAMSWPSAHA